VVLETRHGALVDALLGAGFPVLPVNPDLVARRRGPAGKKDDPEDARICCLLAIDPHTTLRPLVAHSPTANELRSIARDDARAARDQRRLLNRLRRDLLAVFPAAMHISEGEDLNRVTLLRMLATWPTAAQLATVERSTLLALASLPHRSRSHPDSGGPAWLLRICCE
jgi:transposase